MSETPEEPVGPRRVIGTPSPAPTAVDVAQEPAEPAFSAEPPAPRHAKNAERIAAALFVLAFLAGCSGSTFTGGNGYFGVFHTSGYLTKGPIVQKFAPPSLTCSTTLLKLPLPRF